MRRKAERKNGIRRLSNHSFSRRKVSSQYTHFGLSKTPKKEVEITKDEKEEEDKLVVHRKKMTEIADLEARNIFKNEIQTEENKFKALFGKIAVRPKPQTNLGTFKNAQLSAFLKQRNEMQRNQSQN